VVTPVTVTPVMNGGLVTVMLTDAVAVLLELSRATAVAVCRPFAWVVVTQDVW